MKLTPIAANQTEVELADGTTVFFSYKTPVAAWVPVGSQRNVALGLDCTRFWQTEQHYSRTTTKHINQFIARNGGAKHEYGLKPQSFFDALGKS